jgi:MFS family permease
MGKPEHRSAAGVGFALAVVMGGGLLPSPIYALYERSFELAPLLTPVVFATFAAGVLVALLGFGQASDQLGRRRTLLAGLLFSVLSSLVFAAAQGLPALLIARVLSGFSTGLATGSATAWMVDLAGARRGTLLAITASVGGLALAPVLAGALGAWGSQPLRTPYWVHLALLGAALVGTLLTPETVKPSRLRLQLALRVPPEARSRFRQGSIAGACAFAVSGLFSAIAPAHLAAELGRPSPLHAGLLVGLFFLAAALGQLAVLLAPRRAGLAAGCAVLFAGVAVLALAVACESVALLFVAGAVCGVGDGVAVACGLEGVQRKAKDHKGEIDSVFYAVLYLGLAVPTLGVGFLSELWSPAMAAYLFCAAVGASSLGVMLSLLGERTTEGSARGETEMSKLSG